MNYGQYVRRYKPSTGMNYTNNGAMKNMERIKKMSRLAVRLEWLDKDLRPGKNRRAGKAGAQKVILMAAIAFNLKKYLKKGGGILSICILRTIMDVIQGYLTVFIGKPQPSPVLIKTL